MVLAEQAKYSKHFLKIFYFTAIVYSKEQRDNDVTEMKYGD